VPEIADGGGGGFSVTPGDISATAGAVTHVGSTSNSHGSALVSALAAAENAVGDPGAAGSVGSLIEAWAEPLGLLGSLADKMAQALSSTAGVYSTTDGAVARAAR
jgi:hypothetical protein